MRSFHFASILFITFSLFSTQQCLADDTVRIDTPSTMVVSGFTNTSFTLGSDKPSGESISEATAAKVYIPIKNALNNINYSTLTSSGVTTLFDIGNSAHIITFPLLVNIGTTAKYLYAAVKLGSSYFVSASSTLLSANQTNAVVSFSLSALDVCKSITLNGSTACSNLAATSIAETSITPIVYFFLSSNVLAVTGSISGDPATYPGGVYFETHLSNSVSASNELTTFLTNLKIGDGRLIFDFGASSTIDPSLFKKVIVFNYDDFSSEKTGNPTFQSLSGLGSLINRDFSNNQSGVLTLNGLTNGITYNVSIAFLDKFLFATTFSDSRIGKPLQIQELLKKQACFLLTAGFGEEHYVINFFRQYRDQVLAHTWLGQKFIKVYYRTAPQYALILYQSTFLRWVVRSMAYVMYFFFNFYWVILIGIVGLSCYYLYFRKKLYTSAL